MAQINKPNTYFNTVLYTGNGTNNRTVTGVGFQPDWVWLKMRGGSDNHNVHDVVRGANKQLYPNATDAESSSTNMLKSFDTDGFTLGTDGAVNLNATTFVSWNWLADNTSGSSNTDGSITSTVAKNTTSGFSIVSYTGTGANATVGHGLGVAPKMIIIKDRDNGGTAWFVYHSAIGTAGTGRLNSTNAFSDTTFMTTAPSSTVITLTNATIVNGSSEKMIAYCFAEKKGFSKFGSYTGNGSSSNGTFVYTGFRPAFVLIKRTNASIHDWVLIDNKRVGYNADNNTLLPNSNAAEATDNRIDILSNGFKNYNANGSENENGGSYIYMAFAENPLVGTNNIPATAR